MEGGQNKDPPAISAEESCGPDLSLANDYVFMNYLARAEGLLPASFYSKVDGSPFDRSRVDFPGEVKLAAPLLKRTHDLRLLTILAKFHALDRDLPKAVDAIEVIANVLELFWDNVHPGPDDGDYSYRMACLQALDDNPHIVLPLSYAAFITHKRVGPINFRALQLASGAISPREGEKPLETSDFDRAVDDLDLPELVAARDLFGRLLAAVQKIRATWLDRAGYDQAVSFRNLTPFATKAHEALAAIVGRHDLSLAATATDAADDENGAAVSLDSPGAAQPAGGVASFADARDALAAAAEFFALNEPSSPALLLIRQAIQLMGKSFVEVMRILVPDLVSEASVMIGKNEYFQLPIERLCDFAELPDAQEIELRPERFSPRNRAEAAKLLSQVNAFYLTNEPSSPIPFFTERARLLAGRDFLGLLKDLLPEDSLKSIE